MNNQRRLLHTAIAGLVAVAVYAAGLLIIAGNPGTWSIDDKNCSGIGVTVYLLFGLGTVFILMSLVVLPLALIASTVYLKICKFSLTAAILIPLSANTVAISLIAAAWMLLNITPPLWAIAAIIVAGYLVIGSFHRRSRH